MSVPMKHTKAIRLKVKPECTAWLNAAAKEVNFVWNWANETSEKAIRRYSGKPIWLSKYDLNKLSSGSSKFFNKIGADVINCVNFEFALKRSKAKKARLNWRRSGGSKKSLGWVPFKGKTLRNEGNGLRFLGKTFRVFESERLVGMRWRDGCFAQDACGDWWLCVPVVIEQTNDPAPLEAVGIDLGLKDTAVTTDNERLAAGRHFRLAEPKIAAAQRRGHKRQAKRIHRKAQRQRGDALHKFSRTIVSKYQKIVIGNVSSLGLGKTRMAKSVYDAGWGILKTQLHYKGQQAGRSIQVVNESYTSRTCSGCGCLSGPTGLDMLDVRHWTCADCGESHDRDVNAARNILRRAEASVSVSGNESRQKVMI
jgi:IS605 OrfB family transposase